MKGEQGVFSRHSSEKFFVDGLVTRAVTAAGALAYLILRLGSELVLKPFARK
jgi:hypothetical protein